jgi:hypothetical protein
MELLTVLRVLQKLHFVKVIICLKCKAKRLLCETQFYLCLVVITMHWNYEIILVKMDNKRVGLYKFCSTFFVQANNYDHIDGVKLETVSNKLYADEITTSENNM